MKECCGCGVCETVCPTGALILEQDDDGFLFPKVDEALCVHCRQCEKVCFYRSGMERIDKDFGQLCYAAWSTNETIRNLCQSGGLGYMLATRIVTDGGIAYGAAFDSQFAVRHMGANSVEACAAFRGAKYVQSRFHDTIASIRAYLLDGRAVIVFGTPCQIMGLRKALANVESEKLYLVDLVCHGVPSPKLWAEYVQWVRDRHVGKDLEAIKIRDPSFGWHTSIANFLFSGQWYQHTEYNSLYGGHFMLRDSCHSCKFANLKRPGDLTIGDCWGIEKVSPSLDDSNGVSIVLVNTKKGEELLAGLSEIHKERIDIEKVLQPQLRYPTSAPIKREQFWRDYHRKGIDYVIFHYAKGGWLGPIRRLLRPVKRIVQKWIYKQ